MTPNADILIRGLTMEVHSGQNVLVAGPNGCGKSSVRNQYFYLCDSFLFRYSSSVFLEDCGLCLEEHSLSLPRTSFSMFLNAPT